MLHSQWQFFTFISYYELYLIVCAVLLYDWQWSRFVYTSITINIMNNMLCYNFMMAMLLLGNRNFAALL